MLLPFLLSLSFLSLAAATRLHAPPLFELPSCVKGKYFDRVFTVVLENADFNTVITNPYFSGLIKDGVLLTNMHAIFHPSQPNYISMVHGDRCWIFLDFTEDCSAGNNVVDLLEAKGVSWATYQEDYPGNCFSGDQYPYVRKHNPFISMTSIRSNATRCAQILPASSFQPSTSSPQYIFYTPNMLNNGHDTNFTYAAQWLSEFLPPLLTNESFSARTLFVVTFDESASYIGSDQIVTVLIGGKGVFNRKGQNDSTKYNHISVLKLIEDNWDLGLLGTDDETSATSINPQIFK